MSTFEVVETDDGFFEVRDEFGCAVDVFEERASAHSYMRKLQLSKPGKTTRQVSGYRYGNADFTDYVEEPIVVNTPENVKVEETGEIELLPIEPKGGRNSDAVRDAIAFAKANYKYERDVIHWAMIKLGMKRPLATSYVKGNWHKV